MGKDSETNSFLQAARMDLTNQETPRKDEHPSDSVTLEENVLQAPVQGDPVNNNTSKEEDSEWKDSRKEGKTASYVDHKTQEDSHPTSKHNPGPDISSSREDTTMKQGEEQADENVKDDDEEEEALSSGVDMGYEAMSDLDQRYDERRAREQQQQQQQHAQSSTAQSPTTTVSATTTNSRESHPVRGAPPPPPPPPPPLLLSAHHSKESTLLTPKHHNGKHSVQTTQQPEASSSRTLQTASFSSSSSSSSTTTTTMPLIPYRHDEDEEGGLPHTRPSVRKPCTHQQQHNGSPSSVSPPHHTKNPARRKPPTPILRTSSTSSTASSKSSGSSRRGGGRINILSPSNSSRSIGFDETKLGSSNVAHSLMGLALQLTSQEWSQLGNSTDTSPQLFQSTNQTSNNNNNSLEQHDTTDYLEFQDLVDRITALLLVRLLPVAAPAGTFPDLSTTTICRTVLVHPDTWPCAITMTVLEELQAYVQRILQWYRPYVPYHNAEHAYHVTVSTNKLLDLMLGKQFGQKSMPPIFGLRHDPLRLLCLVWAALIHDVDHRGVPNRQLATEQIDHPLAIRYNDQSIAENQSLFLAFDELLHGTTPISKRSTTNRTEPTVPSSPSLATTKPLYLNLRKVMCPTNREYFTFRKYVIDLVLHTDIASPEKAELSKSKFKAANFEASSQKQQQHQGSQDADGKRRGSAGRRRNSNRPSSTFRSRKKSMRNRRSSLSRSTSNTLHNADYRLAPSQSEMSSEMSYDDTTESSDVSDETNVTANTAVAGSKSLKRSMNRKGLAEPAPTTPTDDHKPPPQRKLPLRLADAMKQGVQVTVRTASASKLNCDFDKEDAIEKAKAASSSGSTRTRSRLNSKTNLTTSPVASRSEVTPNTPIVSPDKTPAVPQRRLSTATNGASMDHTAPPITPTNEKRPSVTKESSSSSSDSRAAPDKTPAAPQRQLSQESVPSPPKVASLSATMSASSSCEEPRALHVPHSPDPSTASAGSDRTPLVPQRRGSVAPALDIDNFESRKLVNRPSSNGETTNADAPSFSPRPSSRTLDAIPSSTDQGMPTIHASPAAGDKTPAFPQRRSTMDHQIAPSDNTATVSGTNPSPVGTASGNVEEPPVPVSDKTPSVPQRRLTAEVCATFSTDNSVSNNGFDANDNRAIKVAQRRLSGGFMGSTTSSASPETIRRHSSGMDRKKNILRRKKLGIRRSMDWSGEMVQQYDKPSLQQSLSDDMPDDLKASVVMETIMAVADISQNLQSFDHMVKWSNKLFMELRRAHVAGRGPDVSQNWFPNQIGFLEHYVLPLARKLDETGVFGPVIGPSFARLVETNRDRWLLDGEKVTADVIKAGIKCYPDGTPLPKEECGEVDPRVERFLKQVDDNRPSAEPKDNASPQTLKLSLSGRKAAEVVTLPDSRSISTQSLDKELREVQKRLSVLVEDHEREIARIVTNHNHKVDDLEHELEEMTEEFTRARSKISSLIDERDEALRSVELQGKTKLELDSLRIKLDSVQKEKDAMRKEIERLQEPQKEDKTAVLVERLRFLDEKEDLLSILREAVVHHEKEESRLGDVVDELEQMISSQDPNENISHSHVNNARSELEERRKEKATITDRLRMLTSQHDERRRGLQLERSRLVQDLGSVKDDLRSLMAQKSEEADKILHFLLPSHRGGNLDTGTREIEIRRIEEDTQSLTTPLDSQCASFGKLGIDRQSVRDDKDSIYSELKELLVFQHERSLLQLQETFHLQNQEKVRRRRARTSFAVWIIFVAILAAVVANVYERVGDSSSLDMMCAPAMPGTQIQSGDILKAPWWAPKGLEPVAFQMFCPHRSWTQIEFSGQTLVMSHEYSEGKAPKPIVRSLPAKGGFVGTNTVVVIDQEGKHREYEAPWIRSIDRNSKSVDFQSGPNAVNRMNPEKNACQSWLPLRFASKTKC